jgi:hypothetical protein
MSLTATPPWKKPVTTDTPAILPARHRPGRPLEHDALDVSGTGGAVVAERG